MATKGDKLKALRKYLGLNQTQFGEKIGLAKSSIASFENNINPLPTYVVILIEKIFNVKTNYFTDENIQLNDIARDIATNSLVDIEIFNDVNCFIDGGKSFHTLVPYDFLNAIWLNIENKNWQVVNFYGSLLFFDENKHILTNNNSQILVANHDLVFTGVYDYDNDVVKLKNEPFFDKQKLGDWDFWAVFRFKLKTEILRLDEITRKKKSLF